MRFALVILSGIDAFFARFGVPLAGCSEKFSRFFLTQLVVSGAIPECGAVQRRTVPHPAASWRSEEARHLRYKVIRFVAPPTTLQRGIDESGVVLPLGWSIPRKY
jgi:hypothetical protein